MVVQNWAANYWVAKGCPKEKLMIGMPGYGRTFTLLDSQQNDLDAPCKVNGYDSESGNPLYAGNAGPFTRASGFLSYYEVRHLGLWEGNHS